MGSGGEEGKHDVQSRLRHSRNVVIHGRERAVGAPHGTTSGAPSIETRNTAMSSTPSPRGRARHAAICEREGGSTHSPSNACGLVTSWTRCLPGAPVRSQEIVILMRRVPAWAPHGHRRDAARRDAKQYVPIDVDEREPVLVDVSATRRMAKVSLAEQTHIHTPRGRDIGRRWGAMRADVHDMVVPDLVVERLRLRYRRGHVCCGGFG